MIKVELRWDGNRADLDDDEAGMSLSDNIEWLLDYGDNVSTIHHNNIKLTVKELKDGKKVN